MTFSSMMMSADGSHENANGVFVYIVQRCWYSGPKTEPPVDYRRLLLARNDADQVAYHSAHRFAAESGSGDKVRTLQLPDGSYGFLASNQLFWVRQVSAKAAEGQFNQFQQYKEAHCILSPDGTLLGATSKRRNFLTAEPHSIFVGPQSSHAALQWLVRQAPDGRTVHWVPIGPPPSLDHIAGEWPGENNKDVHMIVQQEDSKRTASEDSTVWFGRHSADGDRPAKRRMCRPISFYDGEVERTTTSNTRMME